MYSDFYFTLILVGIALQFTNQILFTSLLPTLKLFIGRATGKEGRNRFLGNLIGLIIKLRHLFYISLGYGLFYWPIKYSLLCSSFPPSHLKALRTSPKQHASSWRNGSCIAWRRPHTEK